MVYVNYVIAGALGGLGGALAALAVGHVDPETAYWTTSGEFVFIAILGGTGNVSAPFLAAAIFEALRTIASQYAPNVWQMTLGLGMLRSSCSCPSGLWSLVRRREAPHEPHARRSCAGAVNKSFGAVVAAADIDLAIDADSVVSLIGANGAGKTTFLNMVTGYLQARQRPHPVRRPRHHRR